MDKRINRKSASKWDQGGGERALIEIWSEKIVQLRGCWKNSRILIEMSLELEVCGYKYTPEELKTKMHNMINRYRKEKVEIGSTGGSPSEWVFFKEMEKLLTSFKRYHTKDLVADSNNNIERMIKSVEKTIENITNRTDKFLAIEEEKKEILKKFAKKEAKV